MLHKALRSDKAAQRHQPLDGNKAWQGYLSLQTQRQNGISGVNEVCVTHITQKCSLMGKEHIMLQEGKRRKSQRKFRFQFEFLFVLFVLSFIHEKHLHSAPSHHHTYWMCVLYRGEQYFFHRKCKKQLCGELWRRETRWSDLSKGRVKLQTKLPWFILRLFVKHCCSAALTSSSALRPWQMQVSSVTRNQSSEKASQLIPAEGGSQPH